MWTASQQSRLFATRSTLAKPTIPIFSICKTFCQRQQQFSPNSCETNVYSWLKIRSQDSDSFGVVQVRRAERGARRGRKKALFKFNTSDYEGCTASKIWLVRATKIRLKSRKFPSILSNSSAISHQTARHAYLLQRRPHVPDVVRVAL